MKNMSAAANGGYPAIQATFARTTTGEMTESGPRSRQQPGSACEECRRRKLRCDRGTPQCMACINVGIKCVFRRNGTPRGPRKGYLKELQKQIEQLQTRLDEQQREGRNTANENKPSSHQASCQPSRQASRQTSCRPPTAEKDIDSSRSSDSGFNDIQHIPISLQTDIQSIFSDIQPHSAPNMSPLNMMPLPPLEIDSLNHDLGFPDAFDPQPSQPTPTRGFGLGIHLTPMICTDLDQLYFDRVHAFWPMLQKYRYLSWARQPDKSRQRTCLQYAMWTLAASVSGRFQLIRTDLYAEARRRLDALETDSQNDAQSFCVEQVQAWILLAVYELTSSTCNYQRGMVSAGRAFRLVQLMRLHEIDGPNQVAAISHCQGPGDWIDIESMRRTFWVAYSVDRFTSAIDGLPLTFNETQILTRLPAPEAHFVSGGTTNMCFLSEATNELDGDRVNEALSSSFTQSIIVATICGRILEHKQHQIDHDGGDSINRFCRRHQSLKSLLVRHIKKLSAYLVSTSEPPDPMLIFVSLTAYMTVFMLNETIESKGPLHMCCTETHAAEHKKRSLEAAHKIGVLIGTLRQLNHFKTHPFTSIPLLLSGRFCLAHGATNTAYSNLLGSIATALEGLAHVDGLAQNCLQLLSLTYSCTEYYT